MASVGINGLGWPFWESKQHQLQNVYNTPHTHDHFFLQQWNTDNECMHGVPQYISLTNSLAYVHGFGLWLLDLWPAGSILRVAIS